MTKQEERIIDRLDSIQKQLLTRDPNSHQQTTYVFYNNVLDKFRNVLSAMQSYNMDPEQHTKLKTTLCKLVERIEGESRIEALELLKCLVAYFDEQGHFGLCWNVYCIAGEIYQARLREVLPAHLKSAVTLMT